MVLFQLNFESKQKLHRCFEGPVRKFVMEVFRDGRQTEAQELFMPKFFFLNVFRWSRWLLYSFVGFKPLIRDIYPHPWTLRKPPPMSSPLHRRTHPTSNLVKCCNPPWMPGDESVLMGDRRKFSKRGRGPSSGKWEGVSPSLAD